MLLLRLAVAGLLAVVLSACGLGRPGLTWPAEISFPGMDAATAAKLNTFVEQFNTQLGQTLLVTGSSKSSSISVKSVSAFGNVSPIGSTTSFSDVGQDFAFISLPMLRDTNNGTRIAGRAILETNWCTIELGSFLLSSEVLLHPVFWHELGHCTGLGHVIPQGEVMSPITLPFGNYSQPQFQRFFNSVLNSIRQN